MIPPACQGSDSLTNVMSQEASPLSREVGSHCPRFTGERFCSLLLGCPMCGGGGFFSIFAGVGDNRQSWVCRA